MSRSQKSGAKSVLIKACVIVLASAVLGLGTNALSAKPVPLFTADGPGALPDKAPRWSMDDLRDADRARAAVLLIDVRSADAFAAGHPKGAMNAPYESFMEVYAASAQLAARIQDTAVVVILCESEDCPAADRTVKLLAGVRTRSVHVLHGGWDAYEKSGLSVERTP